jgi:hypothetical protein
MAKETPTRYLAAGAKKRPNAGVIKQIITLAYDLLPARVARAIDILLHPCCDLGIRAVAECDDLGTYTVTIALDRKINLNGMGFYQLLVGPLYAEFAEATLGNRAGSWVDNTTTLVLTGVDITPLTIPDDYKVTLILSLPAGQGPFSTAASASPSVGIQATTVSQVTFDLCVV